MNQRRAVEWIALLFIGLMISVASAAAFADDATPAASSAKPVPVQVAAVETTTMIETASFIGSLVPWRKAEIGSANLGNITKVYITQGQKVAQNDPLFLLDDRVAKADLESAQAQLQNVERNLKRSQELWQTKSISRSQLDQASTDYITAQANLNSAQTKLDLLTLRAPFTGVVGIIKFDVGAFAIPGQTLVSLEDNSKLYVDFQVPQRLLPQLQINQPFTFTSDALGQQRIKGQISFIDPSVEGKTRSITVRGLALNPDGKLAGDLGVRVDLQMAVHNNALVVPASALIPTLEGNQVYRVVDHKAQRAPVKVGMTSDGRAEILQGVQVGDSIVTVGQFALEDGMAVTVTSGAR
ncbi:MAG: efflux RND transporter periplasmic adaptor subunit [Candidatus Competibacteraceae bacterium]|nr:efflux RND transporter periplasmic adaptor subunit [Candidatus Competibacteraceae bacterium]